MPDDLRQQVEAALHEPCRCAKMVALTNYIGGPKAVQVWECPDCLPARIAAAIEAAVDRAYEDGLVEAETKDEAWGAATSAFRGEQ